MVLALLAVLAAVGISQFVNFGTDAKIAVTTEKLIAFKAAIVGDARLVSAGQLSKPGYLIDCLGVPDLLSDLVAMPGSGTCSVAYDPFLKQGWRGPYVSDTDPNYSTDAWGQPIWYDKVGRTITSRGPDQVLGTGDDIVISF